MMRMKTIAEESTDVNRSTGGGGTENIWEMRPGGMLVQKRNPDLDQIRLPPPPTVRVRVKYGSMYHEINISSTSTFGELKKMLSGPTGVHHEDQKLLFKDKERDSKTFLDDVGVKDKSKIVLIEDLISQEKRILEMTRIAKMEKAAKTISEISLEVDRLAGQVSAYESVISKGGKVGEKQVVNLIELLMNQLIKLDGIIALGDVKLQRKTQVQRVQKCVETLDILKLKNSTSSSNGTHISPKPKQQQQSSSLLDMLNVKKPIPSSNGTHISPKIQQHQMPIQKHQQKRHSTEQISTTIQPPQSRRTIGQIPVNLQQQQQTARNSSGGSFVITTQWETFDPVSVPIPVPPPTSKATSSNNGAKHPQFTWDLL